MKYKLKKEDYDALDDAVKSLYKANGEDFILDIEDAPADLSDDVAKLKHALDAERLAHKESKKSYTDKLEEFLKDKKVDKDEDKKSVKDIESTDPNILSLKKQLEKQSEQLQEILVEKNRLFQENKEKTILDGLKKISNGKIVPSAVDDLVLYAPKFDLTDDGKIVAKDGTDLKSWFDTKLENSKHWQLKDETGSLKGGNDKNITPSDEKKYKELMAKESLTPQEQLQAVQLSQQIQNKE